MVHQVLNKCDIDIRSHIAESIVLSGGSSMFPGLSNRMQKELEILSPYLEWKVIAAPERKFSAWIGGAIMASMSTFQRACITKEEYLEHGPSILCRKCL